MSFVPRLGGNVAEAWSSETNDAAVVDGYDEHDGTSCDTLPSLAERLAGCILKSLPGNLP